MYIMSGGFGKCMHTCQLLSCHSGKLDVPSTPSLNFLSKCSKNTYKDRNWWHSYHLNLPWSEIYASQTTHTILWTRTDQIVAKKAGLCPLSGLNQPCSTEGNRETQPSETLTSEPRALLFLAHIGCFSAYIQSLLTQNSQYTMNNS